MNKNIKNGRKYRIIKQKLVKVVNMVSRSTRQSKSFWQGIHFMGIFIFEIHPEKYLLEFKCTISAVKEMKNNVNCCTDVALKLMHFIESFMGKGKYSTADFP